MYKVFFKDRTVFFRDDFPEAFRTKSGLFYKYESRESLAEIVSAFFHLEKINTLYLFHNNLDFLKTQFNSLFQPVRAAGGLVRNTRKEFLIIRRNGLWDLPKGKFEMGENSEQAALREVSEECGIESLEMKDFILKTFHAYKQDGKAYLKETDWFEMRVENDIKTSPELKENITEVRWLKPDEASSLQKNTYPLILDVLAEAKIL
jgi:8-oxo-dGTP pyrophosphatase MutT (NUDIX family)